MILTPYPIRNRIATRDGFVTTDFDTWFRDQLAAVNAAPFQWAHVFKLGQEASIAATVVYQTALRVEAVYRVSYTQRITRAGTVSSSLTFTLAWTAGGVAQSQSGAAMTGNTTATQQNGVFVIRADASTTITYAALYASSGATTMTYTLDVLVEQLPEPPPVPVQP